MNKFRHIASLALLPLAISGAAWGAQATSVLTVNATVLSSCTVLPAVLAFGNIGTAADADNTASISVVCTLNTGYSVGLDGGANGGSALGARKMKSVSGSDLLNYGLYRDTNRSQNWGTTTGTGGDVVTGTGNGLTQTLTVYGRVPSGQNISAGAYADTVNITVNY